MRISPTIALALSVLAGACGDDDSSAPDAAVDAAMLGPDSSIPDGALADSGTAGVGGAAAAGGNGGSAGVMMTPCTGRACNCVACGNNCFACSGMTCLQACSGMCFDCGNGCFDCGGSGCSCQVASEPVPLPWTPPFDNVGADGWKDSTVGLCTGMEQILSFDVFSDARGVFAMASGVSTVPPADEDAGVAVAGAGGMGEFVPGEFLARTSVWRNDGTGWRTTASKQNTMSNYALHGAPGSVLFLNELEPTPLQQEMGFPPSLCSLGMVHGRMIECLDLDPVPGLWAVDAARAYAIMGGTRLLVYDGDRWGSDPALLPYPASSVWSDGSSVLAAGRVGTVMWLQQGAWTLQDSGTLEHFTTLWGTTRSDVWAGTAQGSIFHYDGVSWTRIGGLGGVSCSLTLPVIGIWGAGGHVYFHTEAQLAHWDGTQLETIANWTCSPTAAGGLRLTGLWGTAPDQIFLSILDNVRFAVGQCGPAFVVYYDGTSFHRM